MIYKTNYLKPVNFIINSRIYEYDITKANINILYYYDIIQENEYNKLYNMSRIDRQKAIGIKILQDRNIHNIIHNGIIEMRKNFLESNNISDDQILSCKNDAIFLMNTKPNITKFGNIEFVLKNTYTSFLKTSMLELYYLNDMNMEKLDVKGISDQKLLLHENYMIDFIKALFDMIDYSKEDALIMLRSFYNQFMNNQLDIGYYRNFDPDSLYKINIMGNIYDTEIINPQDIIYVNKDCNINFIRDLWQIISFINFNK